MKTKRFEPKDRKAHLLYCGLIAAKRTNYAEIKRSDIAEIAHVSDALVSHYLGNTEEIRKAVLVAAVHEPDPAIILQAIVRNDPIVKNVPEELKQAAIKTIK